MEKEVLKLLFWPFDDILLANCHREQKILDDRPPCHPRIEGSSMTFWWYQALLYDKLS